MTNAYNKKFFDDRLASEFAFAARNQTLLSLVLFDVDHFKKVNDTFGHAAGDAALVHLTRLTQSAIRGEDVAARVGGEEFAIICRGISLLHANVVGERLRRATEKASFDFEGHQLQVTISVGIAAFPDSDIASAADLFKEADDALYRAKNLGRNRVFMKQH